MLGHWGAVFFPVLFLNLLGVFIIWYRIDDLPNLQEIFIHTLATALVLLWYTSIQLLASSWAKDLGSSIAIGLGLWMIFTLLWLVFTTVVAGLSGVGVDDLNSSEYVKIDAFMDLLSPNGLYHHILEMLLDNVDRGIPAWNVALAAIIWTVTPVYLLTRRLERIHP